MNALTFYPFHVCPPTVPEFFEAPGILKAIFASGDNILKVRPRMAVDYYCRNKGPH